MPRNDEGEFELVLGNRQLLSGFFIVVILFGVFFTMGYIVGRHSSPGPLGPTAAAASPEQSAPASRAPSGGPSPGQAEVVSAEPKGEMPPPESASGTRPATAPAETPRPETRPEPRAVTGGTSDPAPGRY